MSVKINRYPASEGGNWSINGRNVMTIRVPDVGFADLHNSYVVFRIEPTVTDSLGNKQIHPMVFADLTSTNEYPTLFVPCTGQALIRNSRVQYSKAQIHNERIDQNVLSQNMDWYTTSRANQRCSANLTGACNRVYGTIGDSLLPNTPFFQYSRPTALVGLGSWVTMDAAEAAADLVNKVYAPSQMRNPDILIPLKHIDQLADGMRQFPMTAFGETQYNIQLENVFNVVSPAQMPDIKFSVITASQANASLGSLADPIILDQQFPQLIDLNNIPIYVGAVMNYAYLHAGPGPTIVGNATVTVKSIQMLGGYAHIQLVDPIVINCEDGEDIDIQLTYIGYLADIAYPGGGDVDPHLTRLINGYYPRPDTFAQGIGATASWEITNAYVELHELKLTTDQQKLALSAMRNMEIPFTEYRTVRKNMLLTTTEYCDTVPYDQGCMGLVVLTPQPNTMTSGFDSALQYRYKINSKDELGRWVIVGPEQETFTALPVGRQLHNYKLESLFSSLGKSLKKYDAPAYNYANYQDTNTHALLPLEIYDNAMNGVVSINLQTGSKDGLQYEMQAKTVFWQFIYQKAVIIKNGQVTGVI